MSNPKSKPRRFWLHYNKPQSTKQGLPVWSVHFGNRCHMAHKIICGVNTETYTRRTQPCGVLRGHCIDIEFHTELTGKITAVIS